MFALFVAVALSFHAARRPAALIGGKRANSALMAAAEEALEHAAIATADATGVVVPTAMVSAPRTLTPEQEIDELYETLELYDGRLLDLEGRQSFVESEAEDDGQSRNLTTPHLTMGTKEISQQRILTA